MVRDSCPLTTTLRTGFRSAAVVLLLMTLTSVAPAQSTTASKLARMTEWRDNPFCRRPPRPLERRRRVAENDADLTAEPERGDGPAGAVPGVFEAAGRPGGRVSNIAP